MTKHRFGHGKAEALAAMFQVVLISISALGLAARAVEQLLAGSRTAKPRRGHRRFACGDGGHASRCSPGNAT
jgi:divalent metal cation (Fe/Co/Zn/Cd) transporter